MEDNSAENFSRLFQSSKRCIQKSYSNHYTLMFLLVSVRHHLFKFLADNRNLLIKKARESFTSFSFNSRLCGAERSERLIAAFSLV
jgi:hypothetical protein